MKQGRAVLCAVFGSFLLSACGYERPQDSPAGIFLKGEHQLRKLVSVQNSSGSVSGSFFFGTGSVSGETHNEPAITFAWLMNDGKTYQISTLPMSKVRIAFDEVTVPTVKFRWVVSLFETAPDETMRRYVKYAIITCREGDWAPNIQLPLNVELQVNAEATSPLS